MSDHLQTEKPLQKRLRGFAAMPAERQRAIASAGGRAAHESGNAHEFDTDAAREAGRKGGYKVSENREHMAAIGRKGGRIGGGRRTKRPEESVSAHVTRISGEILGEHASNSAA